MHKKALRQKEKSNWPWTTSMCGFLSFVAVLVWFIEALDWEPLTVILASIAGIVLPRICLKNIKRQKQLDRVIALIFLIGGTIFGLAKIDRQSDNEDAIRLALADIQTQQARVYQETINLHKDIQGGNTELSPTVTALAEQAKMLEATEIALEISRREIMSLTQIGLDVFVLIDQSISMNSEIGRQVPGDPMNLRLVAAHYLVDYLGLDGISQRTSPNRISVIGFDIQAQVLVPLTVLSPNDFTKFAFVKDQIAMNQTVRLGPGTNFGAALDLVLTELNNAIPLKGERKTVVIFITDGCPAGGSLAYENGMSYEEYFFG
jgi:Mg-chelatase subunit ChlD